MEHLVDEAFLVFEIVIELALAGSGRFDDLVGACGRDALFVKEVGRRGQNIPSGLIPSHGTRRHLPAPVCTVRYSRDISQRRDGASSTLDEAVLVPWQDIPYVIVTSRSTG